MLSKLTVAMASILVLAASSDGAVPCGDSAPRCNGECPEGEVCRAADSAGTTCYCTSSSEALGIVIPVEIAKLMWVGDPPVGRLFKMVSKPVTEPFPFPDPVVGNPRDLGGALEVAMGGDTLICDLPAGAWDGSRGWIGLGRMPVGSKGYKYVNKLAPTNDPCKIAIIKDDIIKVLAKSAGHIDPPGGTGENPDISISFTVGKYRYCAEAVVPHHREIEGRLVLMKDQPAPATCYRCGDDAVNLPAEECDGTDDSACPGDCIPPGGGGDTCGDNLRNGGGVCTCATEQCDGTDTDQCAGLCLPNCTCPEPICNNDVKEVGEECDPAGSTEDCPPGEICGGFCECVPDVACACGSPDPMMYMFRTSPPEYEGQICGTTDGIITPTLDCMGLYIGGGGGALPVPNMVPDQSTTKWNVDQCVGTDVTLATASPAQVSKRHCSEGKRCAGGTNAGQPCIRDRHCPGSTCQPQCWFGSYLAILNKETPLLSTCISDEIVEDSLGGVDCVSGKAFSRIPLDSVVHLTGSDMSASTPGYQPCPICVGGTLDVPGSGICEGGPDKNKPCMPMSTSYDLNNCCSAESSRYTKECTDDSDCPGAGASCLSGCTEYPTSLDCRPHPLTKLGEGLLLTLQMNTEGPEAYKNTVVADENGVFCRWCRDVTGVGSQCFEGNPDMPDGPKGCPDSSVIACRPATYHSPPPVGGNPADVAECGDALRCRTDADCAYPYGTCTQRTPGAWRDAAIRTIGYDSATRPGDLRDRLPHPSTSVSNFCIPPNMDEVVDGNSDLGGPGGLSLMGTVKLE